MMALHDYTPDILGNKSVLRTLRTLLRYKGKIFTIRELAKTAGLSHPETSKVVKMLERRRIVNIEIIGKAYRVTPNEDSYFLNAVIQPLFEAEKETLGSLLSTIRPFFARGGKKIISAVIFGSVAKGQEKETSDVDLLVIAEDKEYASFCVGKANSEVVSKFGLTLSPLIMNRQQFIQKRNSLLEKSIVESYKAVYGKDLREILANVGKTS